MIMEYASGGEVLKYVEEHTLIPEFDARKIIL
jgi:hypothetical protein